MTWFKVDDTFATHAKTVQAGNAAVGLWVRAGSWASANLTDGFVPSEMIAVLGGRRADAQRLVAVGLWRTSEGGYQFHQWSSEGRQPTRDQVEQERAAWRERQRKARAARGKGVGLNAVV